MRNLPCFRHVEWNPGADELRRFAIAMVVGFGVLGLLAAWRHHHVGTTSWALWAAGAALALGGLLPGIGRAVYLAVHVPTAAVGYVVSHVLLTLIFFVVFTPLALLLRLLGKDVLHLRPPSGRSLWEPRGAPREPDAYYHQF